MKTSVLGLIGRRSIIERTLRAVFSMSHLLTIAAAVWTILVFATPHLGPRQLSLNMFNIHELSDRRRTRGDTVVVVVVVVVAVVVSSSK